MKDLILSMWKELLQNQIAMAMIVFMAVVIGGYITMGAAAKDIVIQVITAIGALVTGGVMGGAIERTKNQRAADNLPPTPKENL